MLLERVLQHTSILYHRFSYFSMAKQEQPVFPETSSYQGAIRRLFSPLSKLTQPLYSCRPQGINHDVILRTVVLSTTVPGAFRQTRWADLQIRFNLIPRENKSDRVKSFNKLMTQPSFYFSPGQTFSSTSAIQPTEMPHHCAGRSRSLKAKTEKTSVTIRPPTARVG